MSIRAVRRPTQALVPDASRRVAWATPLLMIVFGTGLVGACVTFGLRSGRGINLDDRMMRSLGDSAEAWMKMVDVLTSVTMLSVGLCLVGCATVALLRGRFALAAGAAVLILGSNLSTQVLKYKVFERIDDVSNSSPSGHTTVSLSIAVAAVLVAPAVWRWVIIPVAGFVATFVASGTIVGHWHRPSDVIAAAGVVLVWTGITLLIISAAQRRRTVAPEVPTARSWLALVGGAVVGLLLVSWGIRPAEGDVNLGLAVVALGAIGLAVSGTIVWAASYADRHLT